MELTVLEKNVERGTNLRATDEDADDEGAAEAMRLAERARNRLIIVGNNNNNDSTSDHSCGGCDEWCESRGAV